MTGLVWLSVPAAVLLLAAAAELAARWWFRHRSGYYIFPPGMRLHLRPDAAVFPQLETSVRFEVNGDGERGEAVPAGPHCRMLVVGGSQPEGYLLDQPTAWPGTLQRLLQTPGNLDRLGRPAVHVGNIARAGVGSEALDVILERVLPRYPRLDVIIILIGASDVLRWLEFGAPPSPPPPFRTAELFRCHPEVTFGWRLKSLALIELARRLRMRWMRPIQIQDRACKWIGRARAMRANASEVITRMPDPTPMLAHFDVHFRRALATARAHADRVLVVRQPWFHAPRTPEELALMWHGSIGRAWQEQVSTFYSLEVLSGLMALLDAQASAIAQELHVEQLDLMAVLDQSVETYYDTFHATPAGARIVAEAVAAAILRQPLLVARMDLAVAGALEARDVAALRQKAS